MRFLSFLCSCMLMVVLFAGNVYADDMHPRVKMITNKGVILLELNAQKAPKSVANFLEYVQSGFYNGTVFHRVIDGFMIQGGGFTTTMQKKPTNSPIINEANNGLHNEKYTIAMARTGDPHSATAQFFINVKNNRFLNHTAKNAGGWGYAVFGKVIAGKRVVDSISFMPTGSYGPYNDVPLDQVVINSATIVK